MNLSELQQEVYTITGRPDLVTETLMGIRTATLKAHNSDFYAKDLFETGIQFATAEYIQQLDSLILFPRYRKIKYLRKYDEVSQAPGDFLDIILPESILDGWGITRDNVAYESGAVLNIRSSTQTKYYLIGFYQHPDVTSSGYSSWVAVSHPYFIVYAAAEAVFRAIGKEEDAARMKEYVAEQFMLLRNTELALTGN